MTFPLKIARFVGDPAGYRFNDADVASAWTVPRGTWVDATSGITSRVVRVNLDLAYLIEEDNEPGGSREEASPGSSTNGG